MKIAINARLLKAEPDDGISRFTREVVKRLISGNKPHKYVLIFDTKPDKQLDIPSETETYVISPASRHPVQWYIWHEWQLPRILQKTGADIFFSPDGIISLRSTIPSVPVIHDINFYHRPKDVPSLTSLYYRHFFIRYAQKAARILAVSDFCRDDIAASFNIARGKIDVAFNGVSEYFFPAPKESADIYRNNLTGGPPFFLFVGNFSPRKNIPGLLAAYSLFRKKSGSDHKLVLTGGRLYLNRQTDRLIKTSPYRRDIILTGSVRHEDLPILYSSAEALVFVPWFEGFGIPAAEAMRCGTPAILSSTTSLPEIGGDAALYADPGNTGEISDAMIRISTDKILRGTLIRAGLRQSEKFTWENTAGSVIRSIEEAAGFKC
ncbi:MAG: glycosyltransferase family 1 protein [Bacteroidales bacterium]|jgi:glycosyltransferase involved in cell wall biosynthesis